MEEQDYYPVHDVGPFLKTGRYLLYAFNGVFFGFSAILFSVCLYIRFDPDMDDFVRNVGFHDYFYGVIVCMIGASLLMLACFMAWCGTWFWNLKLLIGYVIVSFVAWCLNLSGSIYLLSVGLEATKAFPFIQENFRNLIYQYSYDMSAKRSVDIIQEYIGCCGGYSAGDWDAIHMPVPNSCRNQVTGNQYGDSCAEVLSWYLQDRTGWVSGIALCLCFLQFFTGVFVVCLFRGIEERREIIRQTFGLERTKS